MTEIQLSYNPPEELTTGNIESTIDGEDPSTPGSQAPEPPPQPPLGEGVERI